MTETYRGKKTDATGRTMPRRKYVLIEAHVFRSERFRLLSPYAVSLYIELKHRFNGLNNGDLHMSVREAAKVLLSGKDQGTDALKELQDGKFIEVCAKGRKYKGKPATTWYLCEYPKGKAVQQRVSYDSRNITMFADLLQSQEYRTLKPKARTLFLHFLAGKQSYEARTKGVIMSLSLVEAALNCSRPTAIKVLRQLEAGGLITPEFRGILGPQLPAPSRRSFPKISSRSAASS